MDNQASLENATPTLRTPLTHIIGKFYKFKSPGSWPKKVRDSIPSYIDERYRMHPVLVLAESSEVGKEGWVQVGTITSHPKAWEKSWYNYVPVGVFDSSKLRNSKFGGLKLNVEGQKLRGKDESWFVLDSRVEFPLSCLQPWLAVEMKGATQYKLDDASILRVRGLVGDIEAGLSGVREMVGFGNVGFPKQGLAYTPPILTSQEVSPEKQDQTSVQVHLEKPVNVSKGMPSPKLNPEVSEFVPGSKVGTTHIEWKRKPKPSLKKPRSKNMPRKVAPSATPTSAQNENLKVEVSKEEAEPEEECHEEE